MDIKKALEPFIIDELEKVKASGKQLTREQFDDLDFTNPNECLYGQLFGSSKSSATHEFQNDNEIHKFNISCGSGDLPFDPDSDRYSAFEIYSYKRPNDAKELLIKFNLVRDHIEIKHEFKW